MAAAAAAASTVTISLMAIMALRTGLCLLLLSVIDISSQSVTTKPRSADLDQTETKPSFKPTHRNITVGPGERAILKCRVDNLGTKTVTWKRHNDVHPLTIGLFSFTPDPRVTVDYNQRTNEWNLIIQDVRPLDEGIYQCQISTKNEHDTYDITLNVKNVKVTGTEYVDYGATVELVCNATGKPEPPHDVDWFKGDKKIDSHAGNGVIVTKKIETKVLVSILNIRDSKFTDTGVYTCRSSNQESDSIRVHVVNATNTYMEKTFGGYNWGTTTTALGPTVYVGALFILQSMIACSR